VLVLVAAWCVSRARRLDRLHVRADAARAGLHAALLARAAVAQRVAAVPGVGAPGLAAAAVGAAVAGAAEREQAESELGRRLGAVPRALLPAPLLAELVDAEQLVVVARRVYNDAVRDTLALRSRRLVRRLRLAGRAPVPEYFEIVDPGPAVSGTAARQRRAGSVG
ncbi:MAG TPA: hypothetical protein VM367_11015, partial [Pseudonocardia sp.]|nr:hypothetical protein [Pseudonocardia sp.]